MKILLWTDDIMSRVRIESRWKAAGAQTLKRQSADTPDLIVVDLTATAALEEMKRLRVTFPEASMIAFGPHVDGEAFRRAREAGASEAVARSKVVEQVLSKLAAG